ALSRTVLGLLLVLTLGIAACGGAADDGTDTSSDGSQNSESSESTAEVTTTPRNGATDVAPRDEVKASVSAGTIKEITLRNDDGEAVEGTLSDDNKTWKATEPLGYGKSYSWSGTVVGKNDRKAPIEGSFTVVDPESTLHAQFNVGDNRTYGVAEPIALNFEQPVQNKAAVEKALSVKTSKPTTGSWAWLDNDTSVHYRPKEYWKPHTDEHVAASL